MVMSGESFLLKVPFGPLTVTSFPAATVTVTPAGITTGNLPILDMVLHLL
jgi:hypothetical protein